MHKTLWGNVLGTVGVLVAAPVSLVKGAIDALSGGDFDEGVKSVVDPTMKAFGDFGDRHAEHIEQTIITGAAIGIGAAAKAKFDKADQARKDSSKT